MKKFLIFYGPPQAWYRQNANGYTDSSLEASRFSREEAEQHAERGNCFVVEDGSAEMLLLCNKWEQYFLPKIASHAAEVARLTWERDAQEKLLKEAVVTSRAQAENFVKMKRRAEKAEAERDAAVAAKERAEEALRDIVVLTDPEKGCEDDDVELMLSLCGQMALRGLAAAQDAKPDHTSPQSGLGDMSDWDIDTSTGTPILVYQKCSVIQDEQAHAVLALLKGAQDAKTATPALSRGGELPRVGTYCMISGVNNDSIYEPDGRSYSHALVLGYSPDKKFICCQNDGCWPFVERVSNCYFKETPNSQVITQDAKPASRALEPEPWGGPEGEEE